MKKKFDNDNGSHIDNVNNTTSIEALINLDIHQTNTLSKRIQSLQNIKEKKIAAADRHRKLQIKNINELYEYEVQDAEAFFQVNIYIYIYILLLFILQVFFYLTIYIY
jgi:hypothetical protein